MKHTWTRTQPTVDLDERQLEAVLHLVLPGARVRGARQVATGMVNTIYRVDLGDRAVCLKIGQRGAAAAAVEHAVTARVADLVPVPRPLGIVAEDPITGHPCTVCEWAEGERLDFLADRLDADARLRLTRRIGALLARLHTVRFDRTGLLDPDLRVGEPFALDGDGLRTYAARVLARRSDRLGADRAGRLLAWLAEHADEIEIGLPPCLCHGDLGPENVLVDGDRLTVVDWEFACAAHPLLDLGHLLRTPWIADEDVLEAAYRDAGGTLPAEWARLARTLDLFAWLGFLDRDVIGPEVAAAAVAQVDRLTSRRPISS